MTSKVSKEMHELLDKIAAENEVRRVARKKAAAPEVGIFFVYGGHLWVDGTPLDQAVLYGDLKTHDKGHDTFWEELQKALCPDVGRTRLPLPVSGVYAPRR